MPHSPCPTPEQIEQALLGLSSDDAAETVIEHLFGCTACVEAAPQGGESDPLLVSLRALPQTNVLPDDQREQMERLIRRATQLTWLAKDATHATGSALEATTDALPGQEGEELHDFLAPPQAPDEIGRLGGYRVLRVLGAGGMGVVFEAEDLQLNRRVALKAMKPRLAASAEARRRFLREAQSAAAVDHENIVTIHQVGDDGGAPYIAMPLLRGQTLAERLEEL
ncbi:MAG TPA: protein kinase, partial [Pirellulales bacterium]|nr:protein kinase [Pirellulales bacterium]